MNTDNTAPIPPKYLEAYQRIVANKRTKPGRTRKSMRDFIKENREGIDAAINSHLTRPYSDGSRSEPRHFNDKERREWIMNDEGLYRWAQAEGVRI